MSELLELELVSNLKKELLELLDISPLNIEICIRGFLMKNTEKLLTCELIIIISFIKNVVESHFKNGHYTFDSLMAFYINYLLENKYIKEALLLFKKYPNAANALSGGFALFIDYLYEMTGDHESTYTAEQIILFLKVLNDNFSDKPYYQQCVRKVAKRIEKEKLKNPGTPLSNKLLILNGHITPT